MLCFFFSFFILLSFSQKIQTNKQTNKTQATFNKAYESEEEHAKRAAVFAANVELIHKHNANPEFTYKLGVNQFADLTNAEYKEMYLSKTKPAHAGKTVVLPEATAASVDWRDKGAVTPVKNQGQCGSCWSFSTTGSVEGAHAIASGKLVSLSEQQLMDCSTAEGNHGCNGGLMDYAFQYIIKNGGLDTESDYPYTARDGTCQTAKEDKHAATISGFHDVPANSDSQMQAAVAKGPVSVAIEADQSSFQMYKSGVFNGPCGTNLDHGVLVVGYTAQYWIVKNSWGTTWGDQGYIMMSRSAGGASGMCGILSVASYPLASGDVAAPPNTHYEDPKPNGCQSDEEAVQITGVSGDFCSPSCSPTSACPSDTPAGTTARPECVLEKQGSSSPTNCALICNPSDNAGGCPNGASCKKVSVVGVCTYDD